MTVRELIEKLEAMPQDAEVNFLGEEYLFNIQNVEEDSYGDVILIGE